MFKTQLLRFSKLMLALGVLSMASHAFAYNETICSGLVNGKEILHAQRVSTGMLFQNKNLSLELKMDPATEETEIQLVAIVKDQKPVDQDTKTFKIRSQQETLLQGSIAKIDTKFTTPGDGRTTSIQVTCENNWGD